MSEGTELVQISGLSRRSLLRRIALGLTALTTGRLDTASAQHVHQAVRDEKNRSGTYVPKRLTAHEYDTVACLSELIVPADKGGGSAVDAGAPEFIDLLCSQNEDLTHIYTGGVAWVDAYIRKHHGSTFLDAGTARQVALLDAVVAAESADAERARRAAGVASAGYPEFRPYGVLDPSDLSAGMSFFQWMRRMSVDAYYTSEIGIKDLGYVGGGAYSEYQVPQQAIDFVLERSPFKSSNG